MTYNITVEGWRFLPHSYSIVNQFQCLEILKRDSIHLFHRDVPYFANWSKHYDLLNSENEEKIANLPSPSIDQDSDIIYRISCPFRLTPTTSKKTFVFLTSETGSVPKYYVLNNESFEEAYRNSDATLITPSNWSKTGLIRSGANSKRVFVIPHGIDTSIYKPISKDARTDLRKSLGMEEDFVFLHIGAMSGTKRLDLLLKAFVQVLKKFPNARLVLKGLDTVYSSTDSLRRTIKEYLSDSEVNYIINRLTYISNPLPFSEIAKLYQVADAYVSPYSAEGFNLPVLEALGCGIPVICTKGGSTDDFTNLDFALHIESQIVEFSYDNQIYLEANLEHLIELMNYVIDHDSFRNSAQIKAAEFVHQNFTWKHVVDKLLDVFEMT